MEVAVMIPVNATEPSYETFEIFGKKGLFTELRIDRKTVPEGLYVYDLRDECDGRINELKDFIFANHWGTVILNEAIEGANEGVPVTEDDYGYLGEDMLLSEYIKLQRGLKAYRDFIDVYTFGKGISLNGLINVPFGSEEAFLNCRTDISREEWELGKKAFHDEKLEEEESIGFSEPKM